MLYIFCCRGFGTYGPPNFGPSYPNFPNALPNYPGIPGQVQPNPSDPSGLGCGTPPASCPKSLYRSYDGSCNNLQRPVLGTPNTPYTRLLGPSYGDGVSTPTMARSGKPLPSARLVSLALYPDIPIPDPVWTLVAMQYGQIITHDMSMIAGSTQTSELFILIELFRNKSSIRSFSPQPHLY